jgi:hypothetical protein
MIMIIQVPHRCATSTLQPIVMHVSGALNRTRACFKAIAWCVLDFLLLLLLFLSKLGKGYRE